MNRRPQRRLLDPRAPRMVVPGCHWPTTTIVEWFDAELPPSIRVNTHRTLTSIGGDIDTLEVTTTPTPRELPSRSTRSSPSGLSESPTCKRVVAPI
jgi:hypothetical protein